MSPLVEKIIKQLNKASLSTEDRTALTTALLRKLNALPISKVMTITPDAIIVRGKPLDPEQMSFLRESANALKENFARKLINEQVKYEAVNLGINVAVSIDTLMFSKAAIWIIEQEENLIEKLSTF